MKRLLLSLALAAGMIGAADAQHVTNGYGNFSPNFGLGLSISATTTSASVAWTDTRSINNTELYVYNAGADLVFCRWGVGAQTAVTGDLPIPSGTVQVFTKEKSDTVACRASTSTATVYVMTGFGR